ncbi:MAG: hypothetical protein RBU30_22675 [Polyangia bacterium]|nr:hypothetical protein [Polyangia bacterium]
MSVRTCLALVVCVNLVLVEGALAAPSRAAVRKALGHEMATFVAPDGSFSFLQPKGWSVTLSASGATIIQKASDPQSTRIDLLLLPTGGKLTSTQVIVVLAERMKAQYPSFAEGARKSLSQSPDVSAVLFTYSEGQVPMSGMGIAAASGNAVFWADIYGPDSGFKGYDPAALLVYVMGSMTPGRKPRVPPLPKATAKAPPARPQTGAAAKGSAEYQRRMRKAAVMTHYWNNFRLIHPGGVIWSAR